MFSALRTLRLLQRPRTPSTHPRLSVPERAGAQEGRFCVPDWARHRDRHQTVPRRSERCRQTTTSQHQH